MAIRLGQKGKDERIKANVVAAPALAFSYCRHALRGVSIPVQLCRAADDQVLPAPFYAEVVRKALRPAPECHDVEGAGHFDFLAPCIAEAPKLPICSSTMGFDRTAFHRQFNANVVRFFKPPCNGNSTTLGSELQRCSLVCAGCIR